MIKPIRRIHLISATLLAATVGATASAVPARHDRASEPPRLELDSTGRLLLTDAELLARLGADANQPQSWDKLGPAPPTAISGPKVNMMCPC